MDIDYESIGLRIRRLREKNGLSQEMLAEFADTTQVCISNIENGKRIASLKTLISLANALRVTPDTLLAESLTRTNHHYITEGMNLLADCTKEEAEIIISTVKTLKHTLQGFSIT